MENEEFEQAQTGKRHGFAKGFAAGVLGTLAVGILLVTVFIRATGSSLVIGSGVSAGEEGASVLSSSVRQKINELAGYIHLYFYEDVDNEQLADGIYAGLLEGLGDRYSAYYTKQEYEDLQISAMQNYCGIGAGLAQDKDSMQVTVSHIYEGTPAEAAGLLDGDIIVMVEDIEAASMELSELVTYIRGEEGTSVHLQVYREGETDYLEFDVQRANIDLPTVESAMLDDGVGYIQILEFGAPTAEQFETAAKELTAQGMKAMILDVRDNPGGMVTSVAQILDDILPEGVLVYTQDKYGKRQDFTSDAENSMDIPLAVLMNGNSASASEILAGAVRDYEYGTLIGTTTYGKGIVQTIYPFDDGSAIKLTTAKYYTPKGENIHGTGIKPDIELEYEYTGDKSGDYDRRKDNQIVKAMDVLREELEK